MTKPEVVEIADGRAAVFSRPSPDKPTPNEDCAAVIPYDVSGSVSSSGLSGRGVSGNAGVLVVADGMGGQRAGDQASSLAVRELRAALKRGASEDLPLRAAILNGFEAANEAVLALAIGAATTLAVVEIQAGTARPYHVGDSMILAVGQRGKIKLRTVSHSPVGYAEEAGFLDQEEAMHHDQRHLISNMIGAPDMHITIGSALELAMYDTLLVASDGVSDNLHVEQLVEHVRKGPLARAAGRLAEESLRRMTDPVEGVPSKPDDATFILFRRARAAPSS